MTWEQEMREQVKERAEALALELAEEMAQERAEEAREEGAAQNAVETARKLLDEAISMETIARCTGLPLAQVERLRQEASAVEA